MKIITSPHAPAAIGVYSQAVCCGNTVYLSGQIPLDPKTMQLCSDNIVDQLHQVMKNISAVCEAAGASLENIVKLSIYLTDLADFPHVNEIMAQYFHEPYPARLTVGVAALPRDAKAEIDGIVVLPTAYTQL